MIIDHLEVGLRKEFGGSYKFTHRLSATGKCQRARVYHARDVKPTNTRDLKSLVAMARGNDIEELAMRVLKASGENYHSFQETVKIWVEGVGWVKGHVDCFFEDDTVVDVKGVNSSGWWWIQDKGAHEAYIEQINMYCEGSNRSKWIILYVNRDGFPRDDFPFLAIEGMYSAELAAKGKKNFAIVEAGIEGPTPPRPFYSRKEFPCGWCDFQDHCWGEALEATGARSKTVLDVSNDPVLITDMEKYRKAMDDMDLAKKAKAAARTRVMQKIEKLGHNKIDGGGFSATLNVTEKWAVDNSKIPEEVLDDARYLSSYETLNVRRKK